MDSLKKDKETECYYCEGLSKSKETNKYFGFGTDDISTDVIICNICINYVQGLNGITYEPLANFNCLIDS